ncbi:hypothetical protein EIN_409670, partial [Entamoeba invadens IP1]
MKSKKSNEYKPFKSSRSTQNQKPIFVTNFVSKFVVRPNSQKPIPPAITKINKKSPPLIKAISHEPIKALPDLDNSQLLDSIEEKSREDIQKYFVDDDEETQRILNDPVFQRKSPQVSNTKIENQGIVQFPEHKTNTMLEENIPRIVTPDFLIEPQTKKEDNVETPKEKSKSEEEWTSVPVKRNSLQRNTTKKEEEIKTVRLEETCFEESGLDSVSSGATILDNSQLYPEIKYLGGIDKRTYDKLTSSSSTFGNLEGRPSFERLFGDIETDELKKQQSKMEDDDINGILNRVDVGLKEKREDNEMSEDEIESCFSQHPGNEQNSMEEIETSVHGNGAAPSKECGTRLNNGSDTFQTYLTAKTTQYSYPKKATQSEDEGVKGTDQNYVLKQRGGCECYEVQQRVDHFSQGDFELKFGVPASDTWNVISFSSKPVEVCKTKIVVFVGILGKTVFFVGIKMGCVPISGLEITATKYSVLSKEPPVLFVEEYSHNENIPLKTFKVGVKTFFMQHEERAKEVIKEKFSNVQMMACLKCEFSEFIELQGQIIHVLPKPIEGCLTGETCAVVSNKNVGYLFVFPSRVWDYFKEKMRMEIKVKGRYLRDQYFQGKNACVPIYRFDC